MSRWPIPGVRPLGRARELAKSYRAALAVADPETCRLLDARSHQVGEHWIAPQAHAYQDADWITVLEAAELVHRSPRWVYDWLAEKREERSHACNDGLIRVQVAAVLDGAARAGGSR